MNEMLPIVELKNVFIKTGNTPVLNNINLCFRQGEQWAIMGNSGAGKTLFAHALMGKIFYSGEIVFTIKNTHTGTNVMMIEQQHRFKNLSNTSDFYYQQRFNSSDADNSITVREALNNFASTTNTTLDINKWVDILHLSPLLNEPLIQLSNGENKRLQIAEALLCNPAVLILDNPFTGLDTEGRKTLHAIIDKLTGNNIHVILVTSPQELPGCITHIGIIKDGKIAVFTKEQYKARATNPVTTKNNPVLNNEQLRKINNPAEIGFAFALQMKNVSIKYGDKIILDTINWEVKKGECWSISGPNGAGKSTLLSLITADNPQAYANQIWLFDKRRGKGESIWDIKQKIGYVSPELHLFFEQHNSCFDVIASGLFDTIGLFRQISTDQAEQVNLWMELFQLQKIKQRPLFQLSLGQQRMVLLARALIKNPPLLILDEPAQGLDEEQAVYFKNSIDAFCSHFGTTLLYVSHYAKDIPACVTHFLKLEKSRQVE